MLAVSQLDILLVYLNVAGRIQIAHNIWPSELAENAWYLSLE